VAAVGVLYLLVARRFGKVAGLVAALALAVSPVSVAVNRDNNPDAIFVLLLVLAAYCGLRALEGGRLRWVVATAVLVGLAFNAKMLAAGVVVPGLVAAYLFFVERPWRVRFGHLAVAAVVLVAVSGAWIAAVDLTPAASRPYVGSTSDNSALSLALDYNGLGRVTGQTGGTSFGGGLGGAFSGTPGALRLLNQALGDQGGWLLAFAIAGGISALVAAAVARRRRELGALVLIGGWFAAAAVVFSFAGGIIHTYYLSALAPATSALVGIGVVALARDGRRGGAWVLLPIAALLGSAWVEVMLVHRSGYLGWIQTLVGVVAVGGVAALAVLSIRPAWSVRTRSLGAKAAVGVALAALLVAPAAWSATTSKAAVNGVFPGAGPSFVSGLSTGSTGGPGLGGFGGGGGPRGGGRFGGATSSSSVDQALAYAKQHAPGSRWTLIVSSEQEAAPYVVAGERVAAMGGFTGRETVLTSSYLAQLVRSGSARYFLAGSSGFGRGPGGGSNAAVQTITSTCKPVTAVGGLYDCAGQANAIAASGL
jgi:4-amino-4-deoxy-L-arabinose transferase-like glycosyltransferase